MRSALLALSVIFLCSSFISLPVYGKEYYVYDNEQDLTELDTEEELSSLEGSESSKEKILLDMLSSFVVNLEAQMISVKQCAALAKAKTCADQNSFCDSVMGLTSSTGKTINMIQAYMQQRPQGQLRGLASASDDNASDFRSSEFKFSPGDESNYLRLKSKARRLKLEANQYCLANK